MTESKFIQLLKTFTVEEFREFSKFVQSPYHVRRQSVVKMYGQIRKFYPEFTGRNFSREIIYSNTFNGKKYDDNVMRYHLSALVKAAEDFLTITAAANDKVKMKRYYLEELSKRGVDKLFIKNVKESEELQTNQAVTVESYFNNFELYTTILAFNVLRDERFNYQSIIDQFTLYFMAASLDICIKREVKRVPDNKDYNYLLYDNTINTIARNLKYFENFPLIIIYYYELMLLVHKQDKYYNELKRMKDKYLHALSNIDVLNLYIIMSNYCVEMSNIGRLEFINERHVLDKEFITKGIYENIDYVPSSYFMPVVSYGAYLGEFDWTEKYINTYKDRLDPGHADFALNYSYALLKFSQRKFNDALKHLSRITIESSIEKQSIRNLTLRIYYETNSYESALSVIDASKHFLSNDKSIPEDYRKRYAEYIKNVGILFRLKEKKDKSDAKVFYNKLQKGKYFASKEWILEKVKELL